MSAPIKIAARKRENVQDIMTEGATGPAHKRRSTPGGVIIAVSGWLAFVVLLVLLILFINGNEKALRAIEAGKQAALNGLQQEAKQRSEEIQKRRNGISEATNKLIDQQNKLNPEIAGFEQSLTDVQKQIPPLEEQLGKLKANAAAVKEEVQLTGEGKGELGTKLSQKRAEKERLIKEYATRYKAMKQLYEEKAANPEPDIIRGFYATHQNTPFGPAALFAAAEKTYAKKKSADAERLYGEVVRKYPDSAYAQHAQARLQQIKERQSYEKLDVGFLPYKALSFVQ